MTAVPDLDGVRFCRDCNAAQPVAAFPVGTRRYVCRMHMWTRMAKPSRLRSARLNTDRRRLWVIWKRGWEDAKTLFRQTRVGLTQSDIASLLAALTPGVDSGDQKMCIVPRYPTRVLSLENAVIVDMPERRVLLHAVRDDGITAYITLIEEKHSKTTLILPKKNRQPTRI